MKIRNLVGGAAIGALLVGLSACGSATAGGTAVLPVTHTVTLHYGLLDADTAYAGCQGQLGYSDIGTGTDVRLSNAKGEIIGSGSLGDDAKVYTGAGCLWTVKIPDVVNSTQYSMEIGERGKVTESRSELAAHKWTFEITLGGN